jgi:hypothetical protein
VSIDQHISQSPGLIAEQHYTAATVDVDQPTGLGYVHIQKGTTGTANETLESKAPFEKFASSHGSSTKSRKQTSRTNLRQVITQCLVKLLLTILKSLNQPKTRKRCSKMKARPITGVSTINHGLISLKIARGGLCTISKEMNHPRDTNPSLKMTHPSLSSLLHKQ